jgi:hypothetical protein
MLSILNGQARCHKALPRPPAPPDPSSEFAEGSRQLASSCDLLKAQSYRKYGDNWVARFYIAGATDVAAFLHHFLDGSGTPIDRPDGSPLSEAAKATSALRNLNDAVLAQVKKVLDTDTQDVDVTSASYNPDFSAVNALDAFSPGPATDMYLASDLRQ